MTRPIEVRLDPFTSWRIEEDQAICADPYPWPKANHDCRCLMTPDHMSVIPQCGHGCPCGAIWGQQEKQT